MKQEITKELQEFLEQSRIEGKNEAIHSARKALKVYIGLAYIAGFGFGLLTASMVVLLAVAF